MTATDPRYTLTDLADLAGVTPRTVRYYLSQGLLPSLRTAGPGPKYDDGHLARLRVIRRLQREHQPLAAIRRQLEALEDEQILELAEPATLEPGDSALDYIRRVLSPHTGAREQAVAYMMTPRTPASATAPLAPTAPAVPVADVPSEPRIERSQWERVAVGPDVEIHIRRPLARATAKRVDRLLSIARELLEEDPS